MHPLTKGKDEMSKVTAEQVKAACLAAGIKSIEHHECSICLYMTAYLVRGDQLYFDPSCDCTGGRGPELSSWQDAADWINMQTQDDIRAKIAGRFGIVEQP